MVNKNRIVDYARIKGDWMHRKLHEVAVRLHHWIAPSLGEQRYFISEGNRKQETRKGA